MSEIRKTFNVLILLLDWESKGDKGTSSETWNALFLVSQRLAAVKNADKMSQLRLQPNTETSSFNPAALSRNEGFQMDRIDTCQEGGCSKDSPIITTNASNCSKESPIIANASNVNHETATARKILFERLPTELLVQVLVYLDQSSLASLAALNKRFYRIVVPQLYSSPYLTSPGSIYRFLATLERPSIPPLVSTIIFAPTKVGSLSNPNLSNPRFELIPYVHSGLFNILINTRSDPDSELSLIHQIFYQFSKKVPKISSVEERGCHKENRQSLAEIDANGKHIISRIPSSCVTLSFLLRSCQRWHKEFPEWNGLKDSTFQCYQTVLMLLDWFQGDFHPIWHLLGSTVVRSVKHLVQNKCRAFLSHINSSLLLQVRFITGNSQRLLDCYCLIYYRVLSLAQNLDVQGLSEAMHHQLGENATDNNSSNQKAAKSIYEALTIIFHFRIPSELQTPNKVPEVPVELMRNILLTFPPSSINGETAEFISNLVLIQLDEREASTPMLEQWKVWLLEIIHWHEASIEMEPVKDLLRKSMSKIDSLRTIQRRYGVDFME